MRILLILLLAVVGATRPAEPGDCPEGTLLNPALGVCAPVEDQRSERPVLEGVAPPDLRTQRGTPDGSPHYGSTDATEGALASGVVFRAGRLHVDHEGVLYTRMVVRPAGVGNLSDWLYTTSTNRVDRSVEVVGMYRGPNVAQVGVYDWSCSPASPCAGGETAPAWIWARTFNLLACYYRTEEDDGGHLLPSMYYANRSLFDAGRWQNLVYFWDNCNDRWALVYSHSFGEAVRDCSAYSSLCGWWGPIMETFVPNPHPPIPEMGFYQTALQYDGATSDLPPEDTIFYDPGPWWSVLHRIPNRSWAVAGATSQAVQVSFAGSGSSAGEGGGTARPAVKVTTSDSQPLRNLVRVSYSTSDGTARAGADYTAVADVITFQAGTPSGSTTPAVVPLNDDPLDEDDETFLVSLSNPQGAGLVEPSVHTVTIGDNDPLPSLSASDCAVTEGNGPPVPCPFRIFLSPASGRPVRVVAATSSTPIGTATPNVDYVPRSLEVLLPAGTESYAFPVSVLGDLLDEADETFSLNLSAPVNATISGPSGMGTILDDDPLPSLSVGDCTVTEATGANVPCRFTLSLSAPSGRAVSVSYATADGSAKAGLDYVAVSGTKTFPAGTTSLPVDVPVIGDLSDEPDQTFSLNLSAPMDATIADGTGLGTIVDDDPPPGMSIADVRVSDRNFGTVAYFTVSLSAPSGFPVSVNYATMNGTAMAGQDYVATAGTLSFPLDTGKMNIAVPIIQDVQDEGSESFLVDLSLAVNASILDGRAEGVVVERATPALCARRLDPLDDQTNLPVDLLISEISPGHHIEIYNTTAGGLALGGARHQLVSPNLARPLSLLAPSVVVPARGYARLPWPAVFTDTAAGGEILLYRERRLDDPSKIVDFVCWGVNPHGSRKEQAESVGKWTGPCAPALSDGAVHRRASTSGTSAADYDVASPPSPMSCAALYTVTQTDDLGDGVCDDACTLREAVDAANQAPGHDTIFLPAGSYSLGSPRGGGFAAPSGGGLVLTGDTDIVGDGARSTTIDGGGRPDESRVFEIAPGAAVSIRGLTLQNGASLGDGGAIASAGTLTLVDGTLRGNTARDGGAIAVTAGQATLRNVTLSDNAAAGHGGAVATTCSTCSLTLLDATLSGNRADGDGGGAYHGAGSTIAIRNSTLTANRANADGDGVGAGGGIAGAAGGAATLRNSVLAGNSVMGEAGNAVPSDCANGGGYLVSEGYNLVGTDNACGYPATTGDQVGSSAPIDPLLAPLANNRGPADTHALLAGSPALDTATPAAPGPGSCEATDERSFRRPQDGNGDQISRCDKGAFERCPLPFQDVDPASPLAPFIAETYCRGISSGCSSNPPSYCPGNAVTRAQMAVFLVAALGEPPSGAVPTAYFSDVADNGFAGHINRLFELGITGGCGAGVFCPNDPITRKQLAVFLIVALEERPSGAPYNQYFSDIADDGFAPYINRLFELGISGGCDAGRFCPDAAVTRGEMAVFLASSFFRY